MSTSTQPIVIAFPLRGEWAVPQTPGTRVPSHGTNRFGTRYAYDFLQVDWNRKSHPCYRISPLRYLFAGVRIDQCYCYGKEIYAPFSGTIVSVEQSCTEREKAHLLSDLRRARQNSTFDADANDPKSLTGNAVVLKRSEGIYAAFCHLQPDSIKVSLGQEVQQGDLLGCIGHSGNSTFPHLHFQLMDSLDMTVAQGLPCAFERYELFDGQNWNTVTNGIPTVKDRIRFQA